MELWRFRQVLLILLSLILLGGCVIRPQPDLQRLYASAERGLGQPPVVIIPGLMGSRLKDSVTGREVWPGSIGQLLFSSYEEMALEIDPVSLEPKADGYEVNGITDRTAGRQFYAPILRVLERAGHYRYRDPGDPVQPGRRYYYVFDYDWRQDNARSAHDLGQFVARIRADFRDPGLKVDIVAHSMGGLIARYYLRYGERDVLDGNDFPVSMAGAESVRRVILLGTPNLGSVEAVKTLISGRTMGWRRVRPEVLATMPALYQLLPHAIVDWLATTDGRLLERDQFDLRTWQRFQWGVFDPVVRRRIVQRFHRPEQAERYLVTLERFVEKRLERARRFLWSLTVPLERPRKLIVFGGDCDLTPARLVVEEVKGDSVIRMHPEEVAHPVSGIDYRDFMLEPGDGLVTKASLLGRDALDPTVPRHKWSFFPLDYSFFLCESHDSLTGNVSFQDNLLHALLSRDERL